MINTTKTRTPTSEVWMELRDLKKLKRLMVIQEVSQRQLAVAAGYKSHAYMGRILRGEVKTLEPAAAARIAHYLRVAIDDLFLVRVSTRGSDNGRSRVA